MKRILIIGCGYGGVVSAWGLSSFRRKIEVTVIDRSKYFNFLPLLPDCLGRKIPLPALCYPIQKLSSIYRFNFINEEAQSLDLEKRKVFTAKESLNYDFLIIASGSETNFYGNDLIKKYAYKLDDCPDAQKLKQSLEEGNFNSYIIAGGGYTGVEIATNLRIHLNKIRKSKRIIIVERAQSILGPLPEWMKNYVYNNLRRLDIEVFTGTVIEKLEGRCIRLSDGRDFDHSLLIWAAGVKTSDFIQKLNIAKNPQGRIKVDEYLRLNDTCFVIGDASYFSYRNITLRMAVQFAIAQGSLAVRNIINTMSAKKLHKYHPADLGYIIPMANNLSCGNILGINMQGLAPTLLHYFMSVYRSYGFKNKLAILETLTKGGG